MCRVLVLLPTDANAFVEERKKKCAEGGVKTKTMCFGNRKMGMIVSCVCGKVKSDVRLNEKRVFSFELHHGEQCFAPLFFFCLCFHFVSSFFASFHFFWETMIRCFNRIYEMTK